MELLLFLPTFANMKNGEKIQAFIPAAGLGTRLRPLTDNRPKALVEVGGKTLLERAIERVKLLGARHIVVNVHHFAEQIIDFLQSREWGAEIAISDERNMLLDTGGAIRHAAPLMQPESPILIHNVDVLSCINLDEMLRQHTASGRLSTLAVSQRQTARTLLFDSCGQLAGWTDQRNGEQIWSRGIVSNCKHFAFSGIAIVSANLPKMLPPDDKPYPIIPEYLKLAATNDIGMFEHSADDWIDVGKLETIAQIENNRNGKFLA